MCILDVAGLLCWLSETHFYQKIYIYIEATTITSIDNPKGFMSPFGNE